MIAAWQSVLRSATYPKECLGRHTLRRGVLSKVLGLVSAENASGLDLRGRSPREFLVEGDDTLHLDGVGGGANGLDSDCQPVALPFERPLLPSRIRIVVLPSADPARLHRPVRPKPGTGPPIDASQLPQDPILRPVPRCESHRSSRTLGEATCG